MRSKLTLALLIVGALLTMGAKLTEQPIQDFTSIAGTWKGFVIRKGSSQRNPFTMIIKEDGSLEIDTDDGKGVEGTMRIHDGRVQFDSPNNPSQSYTCTLHEGGEKRVIKDRRNDGAKLTMKPAKKKRKKKKKKANQDVEKKEY